MYSPKIKVGRPIGSFAPDFVNNLIKKAVYILWMQKLGRYFPQTFRVHVHHSIAHISKCKEDQLGVCLVIPIYVGQ
jgi:hypothetical protein